MFRVNNLQLTDNFKLSEFACRDGSEELMLDMDLVHKLQVLRNKLGKPIRVTSGYRNPEYNEKVGGVKNSQHLLGKAADIQVDGMDTVELSRHAKMVGFNGIGIYKNFVHVDVRDVEANWYSID